MPPRAARILLIAADRRGARRPLAAGPGARGAVHVTSLAACLRERLPARSVTAAFVEVSGAPSAALRSLRGRLPGVPLIPVTLSRGRGAVRPGRRRPGRRPRHPVLPLRAPVDPRLLVVVAGLVRRMTEAGARARSTLAHARVRRSTLAALASIVRATGSETDPLRIIEVAMERVRAFLGLRGWMFLQADADQRTLTIERTGGEGAAAPRGRRIGFGRGIPGRAAQGRKPVFVAPPPAGGPAHGATGRTGATLAVPLLSRGRVVGVVEALGRPSAPPFRASHARLLALLLEPVAVAVDNATLLKRSEELSITDDLTKLTNSRYLNASLRREVERSKRYRTPVSLIFLDLDGFKDVNDQYGHLWGSRTLVEVGQVISGTVREIDVVSRFGGDEFTVILPQTGPEGATIIADRIRQRIAATPFLEAYGLRVRITASVGIASFPDHGRTKDDLIARADQAMYAVKGRGKDGVALADPGMPRPAPLQTAR